MSDDSTEERINSIVVETRILESTFNELSARENLLERALIENRAALEAIKSLADGKTTDVLMQVGGGTLLKSAAPSTDRVLVNLGANVVVEKSREEALAMIEGRAKELESTITTLLRQRSEIAERLEADREVLQTLLSRADQKG
ncbi:MAG TPA: prefoldin subunit alpha [Nitrososphaerales archaeon]|nr:prefoldin subunit alpha [Nitrososphaerales archaeon]